MASVTWRTIGSSAVRTRSQVSARFNRLGLAVCLSRRADLPRSTVGSTFSLSSARVSGSKGGWASRAPRGITKRVSSHVFLARPESTGVGGPQPSRSAVTNGRSRFSPRSSRDTTPLDGGELGNNSVVFKSSRLDARRVRSHGLRAWPAWIYLFAGKRSDGTGHLWHAIILHSLHIAVVRRVNSRFCTPRAIRSSLFHRLLGGPAGGSVRS